MFRSGYENKNAVKLKIFVNGNFSEDKSKLNYPLLISNDDHEGILSPELKIRLTPTSPQSKNKFAFGLY